MSELEMGRVEAATQRDIDRLGGDLADSALAASALELARQMDGRNSATSKAMVAKALNETMERLSALAPPKVVNDDVTDLAAERKRRRAAAGISAAPDLPRT